MAARKQKPVLAFVVDSNEQLPYRFYAPRKDRFEDGGCLTYHLPEADYSVEIDGVLLPIRIERKSISDLFGVVGKGRDRFAGARKRDGLYQSGPDEWREAELQRLRPFKSYLLIEATPQEIRNGIERSQIPGEAALGSAICWSVSYNLQVVYAGDRRNARDLAQRILEEFAWHWGMQKSE